MENQENPTSSSFKPLLDIKQVEVRVNKCRAGIYEMMGRTPPEFPRPLKISRRSVRWTQESIDEWIQGRINASQVQP